MTPRPVLRNVAAALLTLCTSAAAAQENWITSLTPGDVSFVGWAHTLPHGPLWFHCAGDANGRPISTYSGAIAPAFTHGLTIELRHAQLGTAAPGAVRGDISIDVDGTRYQLPPMDFRTQGTLSGWFVDLSMGDPMFTDIRDGGTITVFAGASAIASHSGAIGPAVSEVTRFCAEQFAQAGRPLPEHAAAAFSGLARRAGPMAPSAPQDTMERMIAAVRAHCGDPFDIIPEYNGWTQTDLNRDGAPDTILFWGAVGCRVGPFAGSVGGGNCGASQCLTSVFVSGTGRGAEPDAEFFTQGPVLDPARPGDIGFGLRLGACREAGLMPDCVTWHRWTGTQLVRIN